MIQGTRIALALGLASALAAPARAQTPLGTAFSYQGRLSDNGNPANGAFDLQFILYDALGGGSQVGPIVLLPDVAVVQGLFTVTLDFGAVFTGSRRWLEIGVRPGAGTGAYSILSPRQDLTATPGALFSATTPWGGITGKPAGFADDVDDDTTYTQGPGITIAGTVISVTTGGITSGMIADGAVTSLDIAIDTIAAVDIATGGVGTAEILDGTVLAVDIASDTITATQIAAAAVGTLEIQDGSVTSAEIAADTVQAADIASGAVGASEMGPDAVGTAHIQNGTISVIDLNTVDVDARYVNATEVLTAANYGSCGTYSLMSCSVAVAGNAGPACNEVPVGGLCRVTSAICGLSASACSDGSAWYVKLTP